MVRTTAFLLVLIFSPSWSSATETKNGTGSESYLKVFTQTTDLIARHRYFDAHMISMWGQVIHGTDMRQSAHFQLLDVVSLWKLGDVTEALAKAVGIQDTLAFPEAERTQAQFLQRWITLKENMWSPSDSDRKTLDPRLLFYLELTETKRKPTEEQTKASFLTPELEKDIGQYVQLHRYHPAVAGTLSAILPGAGHLYLGQPQNALLTFLLNALAIGASVEFFRNDLPFAGAATSTLASIFYFGGVISSVQQADVQNAKLERPSLNELELKLFPELTIRP